jgi:hypothetical protein
MIDGENGMASSVDATATLLMTILLLVPRDAAGVT